MGSSQLFTNPHCLPSVIFAMFAVSVVSWALIFLSLISRTVPHPLGHNNYNAPDRQGAVASESSICSKFGLQMFKDGGNAADALVATVFCVGVIGCYHSGIGGGGFMLVRAPNGSYEFIDFRETAPASAFQDMYNKDINASIYGGLARCVYTQSSLHSYLISVQVASPERSEDWHIYIKTTESFPGCTSCKVR